MKVYLAGAMTGLSEKMMNDWRLELSTQLKHTFNNIDVINPVEHFKKYPDMRADANAMTKWCLEQVSESDLVIARIRKNETSLGTMGELTRACDMWTPICVYSPEVRREELHPFIQYMADFVAQTHDDVIEFTRFIERTLQQEG